MSVWRSGDFCIVDKCLHLLTCLLTYHKTVFETILVKKSHNQLKFDAVFKPLLYISLIDSMSVLIVIFIYKIVALLFSSEGFNSFDEGNELLKINCLVFQDALNPNPVVCCPSFICVFVA